MINLTDHEFDFIVKFMRDNYGINLSHKRQLIESRLYSLLVEKKLNNFSDYFEIIKKRDQSEISVLITKLTTNHTYFYREPIHYEFLKNVILPYHLKNNRSHDIRIWSAGCSSGEEAYTAIMVMKDFFGMQQNQWDFRILATDISLKVLNSANQGIYPVQSLENLPPNWKKKYFIQKGDSFELSREIKDQVVFKTFNLMDKFEYRKPFDLIFCRNVMIYFEQPTKNVLVSKFYNALNPGGYFFIGHSESILKNDVNFITVQPSIYQKGF